MRNFWIIAICSLMGPRLYAQDIYSEAAASYQSLVTGQPANRSFLLNGVKFDGVEKGILMDAKSGMGNFVKKSTGEFYGWFKGANSLVDQTRRQMRAAGGAKIQWYFENKAVMEATKKLFASKGINGIELIYKGR